MQVNGRTRSKVNRAPRTLKLFIARKLFMNIRKGKIIQLDILLPMKVALAENESVCPVLFSVQQY